MTVRAADAAGHPCEVTVTVAGMTQLTDGSDRCPAAVCPNPPATRQQPSHYPERRMAGVGQPKQSGKGEGSGFRNPETGVRKPQRQSRLP